MKGPMYRHRLKYFSRQTLQLNLRLCLRAATGVVAVTLLLSFIQMNFGHPLTYMIMEAAGNPGVYSDFQITGEGIAGALRLDTAGVIFALRQSWGELGATLVENLVVVLVSAPITYGAVRHFLGLLRRQAFDTRSLFSWYADLRLILRSAAVELVLSAATWLARIAGVIPGLLLFVYSVSGADTLLAAAASRFSGMVMLFGMVVGYFFSCQLEPARYFLADRPELGVTGAFRAGWRSLKGRRFDYFWFAISFLGWELISLVTYGLGEIYLLPYRSLATTVYLGIAVPEEFGQEELANV